MSSGFLLYLFFLLSGVTVLFIFIHVNSKNEQGKYFQELSNSFEDPALICDFTGKVLFTNRAFVFLYGPKIIPIEELLDISDIKKMPLGTDTKLHCRDGMDCKSSSPSTSAEKKRIEVVLGLKSNSFYEVLSGLNLNDTRRHSRRFF